LAPKSRPLLRVNPVAALLARHEWLRCQSSSPKGSLLLTGSTQKLVCRHSIRLPNPPDPLSLPGVDLLLVSAPNHRLKSATFPASMNLSACAANNDTVCRATSLGRATHNRPTPHEMVRRRAVPCPDELSVHSTHLGNGAAHNPACDAVIGRGRHDRPAFQCAPACQYLSSIDA